MAPAQCLRMALSEHIPALLSSDDYGSSVEREAFDQVLWQAHMRAGAVLVQVWYRIRIELGVD